uniref:PNP_UDP_1 domain-containing protein n=1 Tax=Panagrellus redivivus TaxID=6233 RepID=A0A7E4WAI0_PANRE
MTLSFTPIVRSEALNVARISRVTDVDAEQVHFAAAGPYAGIIINKYQPGDAVNFHLSLNFSLLMRNAKTGDLHQEVRTLRFLFDNDDADETYHNQQAMNFFSELMADLPPDYASFFKKLLVMLKDGHYEIQTLEIETKIPESAEAVAMPEAHTLDAENEIEELTMGHVQELLERAFPNGLPFNVIADMLRADDAELESFLIELENNGIAKRCGDEWIRAETISERTQKPHSADQRPTIAIITCLFVEKLAVDAIIEDARTVHKYKSGGDSNIYTIGKIGKHTVVATKLAIIGDSREATISAGSITTRLLGNFQHIEHVFILGIGGGVPHYTSTESHVRRGDVVISYSDHRNTYSYAHSFNRNRSDPENIVCDANVRHWNPKVNDVASIIAQFGEGEVIDWQNGTEGLIKVLEEANTDTKFTRPQDDVLALPLPGGGLVVVNHPDSRVNPILHLAPVGAICSVRYPGKTNQDGENHFDDSIAASEAEVEKQWLQAIHKVRQEFIANERLRALDAGFDSVIAAIEGSCIDSWAVVLGIADYFQGNSRGAQEWKPYAAANAASLLREAIVRIP